MKILNLGCGSKTSPHRDVLNIDWSVLLRLRKSMLFRLFVPVLLNTERRKRFDSLADNILVHDLSRGIPFPDGSIDVVYHSHMVEHLDRDVVPKFLRDTYRVLKPGGIQRIVVPDLERLCLAYIANIADCDRDPGYSIEHDSYIAAILEQCVRKEAAGSGRQPSVQRFIENLVLGDARRRGETHQWMYDRVNLTTLLQDAGFKNPRVELCDTSRIDNWATYGLDVDVTGKEYNAGSLYIEAEK